jgi:phosphoglycerate dehydrogenase-like enzyme
MSQRALLCHPVGPDELAAARARFPQVVFETAGREGADGALAGATIIYGKPSDEMLVRAPRLAWVQGTSAGMEGLIASPVFQAARWTLTTASGMHESCAEHAIALLLGATRKVAEHARLQDRLHWESRSRVATPLVLAGRTLGVLGLGAIGRRVALIARALGMHVLGFNASGRPAPEADAVHAIATLDAHLPALDVVVCVLPATPDTDDLLDATRLARLPAHAIVVNVGRGNCIDEDALAAALAGGRLAHAALDVFKTEPLPADSPFYRLPNVTLTPHIGGHRPDYDQQAFALFLDNLERFLAGKPLRNVVERGRGY